MGRSLREYADGHGLWSVLLNLSRVLKGYQPVFLDYPVDAKPRYGYGKPDHPELRALLAARDAEYEKLLTGFLQFADELRAVPAKATSGGAEPEWNNQWFSGLDLIALYGIVASSSAEQIIEIGSGQSTKIACLARKNQKLRATVTSIDPNPRAEIDALCDRVVRQPLERCDTAMFENLRAGDILFFDGSHRTFMNSDVTVFFLEILPRLRAGVMVHIHDIFLPQDYVPWWEQRFYPHRYWNEQYMLAASLLAGHSNYEVMLPNHYVANAPELAAVRGRWSEQLAGITLDGSSFWIQTR